ncbi:aspartate aminotransferase family protein [Adlercreutzia murintestinalis]|uniref:aspartate aminotransferase family protein n=1 Tax=Adlercreutzia murintestinalis TaxID=2941325 RepID=UPI00203F2DA9|nr:aspartate aminotransferase family protein [Adlercreutzia murintestinalis]
MSTPSLDEQQQLETEYVMPTFARKPVEFVSGSGMHLTDSTGKCYLDFLSGIGVCSLGHCHPAVVTALRSQAEQLIHVSNYFYIENRGQVARGLSDMLNAGLDAASHHTWKTFFANSGAEANECAIKLARLHAHKQTKARDEEMRAPSLIVTLVKSFHGRTMTTLTATGQSSLQHGFEPLPEGFVYTPINDIDALQELFARFSGQICAMMLEPIQGESGVHPCTVEFLQEARRLTSEADALLICDEVQCGIYRTGDAFAFQSARIVPDVVTMAKGIASGMVCGACAARDELGEVLTPGTHGSTFGGSNLAMAAARATLRELSDPAIAANVNERGSSLRQRLETIPGVRAVRGRGLMVGVDLDEGLSAPQAVDAALEAGLVINATGPQTLRFLPPLICTDADIDEMVAILTRICAQLR